MYGSNLGNNGSNGGNSNLANNTSSSDVIMMDKGCHCQKSNCLKLYCDCFRTGAYCKESRCTCNTCYNKQEHQDLRMTAVNSILERNPFAFKSKIVNLAPEAWSQFGHQKVHEKGCNCKKSNCLKKYCECYQGNSFCSLICRCKDCYNNESGAPSIMTQMPEVNLLVNNIQNNKTIHSNNNNNNNSNNNVSNVPPQSIPPLALLDVTMNFEDAEDAEAEDVLEEKILFAKKFHKSSYKSKRSVGDMEQSSSLSSSAAAPSSSSTIEGALASTRAKILEDSIFNYNPMLLPEVPPAFLGLNVMDICDRMVAVIGREVFRHERERYFHQNMYHSNYHNLHNNATQNQDGYLAVSPFKRLKYHDSPATTISEGAFSNVSQDTPDIHHPNFALKNALCDDDAMAIEVVRIFGKSVVESLNRPNHCDIIDPTSDNIG